MSGVDDFILSQGGRELLNRINEPIAILIKPQNYNVKKAVEKGHDLALALAPIEESLANTFIDEFVTKNKRNFKKRVKHNRYDWNISKPAIESGGDLVINELIDSIKARVVKLINKISSKCFRNSQERSFIVIPENNPRILADPKDAAFYFSNYISCRNESINKDGESSLGPHYPIPINLMNITLQNSENLKPLKPIDYFSKFPIFSKNKCLSAPGYHPEKNFYYLGDQITPSKGNMKYLNRFLNSFPFESETDKHNYLGLLLGSFDRLDFIGEYPMIAIKGDIQSLGKTMLMDCFSVITEGSEATLLSLSNEEETTKALVTCLMSSNIVIFDNIKGRANNQTVSSPFLEAAVTSKTFKARLLGGNNNFSRPNTFMIGFTLNGGVFSHDLLVRQVIISLHSSQAHKLDYDFDVLGYVKKHRNEIISALAYMRGQYEE